MCFDLFSNEKFSVVTNLLLHFVFSREQQRSRELNIVTGFQLMDGDIHLFILEGIRDRAVSSLWSALPKPENSGTILKNNLSYTIKLPYMVPLYNKSLSIKAASFYPLMNSA